MDLLNSCYRFQNHNVTLEIIRIPKDHEGEVLFQVLPFLCKDRYEKVELKKTLKSKLESACSGLLLQKMIAEKCNVSFEESQNFRFAYGSAGKPSLIGNELLHFNLSHSGEYIACIVAKSAVGIDLQEYRTVRGGIVNRFFAPEEEAYLQSVESNEYQREFFKIWTAKESFSKMTGTGLGRPMKEYVVDLHRDRILDGEKSYPLFFLDVLKGYEICVCFDV